MKIQSILLFPWHVLLALLQTLFEALVTFHVALLTAVLSHPHSQQAMAQILVQGMNEFLTQPDLDEKIQIMSETMSKHQEEAARNAGQEFPKLVGNFIQGMMMKNNNNKQQQHHNNNHQKSLSRRRHSLSHHHHHHHVRKSHSQRTEEDSETDLASSDSSLGSSHSSSSRDRPLIKSNSFWSSTTHSPKRWNSSNSKSSSSRQQEPPPVPCIVASKP